MEPTVEDLNAGNKKSKTNNAARNSNLLKEIPTVDWLDLDNNRSKFIEDLRYALAECGLLVLTHAPGRNPSYQCRCRRLRSLRRTLLHTDKLALLLSLLRNL